ncbi:Signal transduction histidine kinase [Marivirga sericea]|uniref:histidine kinase n=1 Tax=Marivirga sericea TaxID=1028 RepID=A0A1X7KEF1_9BACT|nr:tetratricopeptide repeat protein [Marivirga sericea]SMG39636.1 Signal transduction histidine kinase [Marivirga sericea]
MKKIILLFLVSFLLGFFSVGQTQIDSLRQILSDQDNDSNKVKTYLQFFYTDLYYSNPEEVIQYTREAADLSRAINYHKGEVEAYNSLGYIYRVRSENDSAFHFFGKALKLAEPINYNLGILDAYVGLGNTYNQLSKWQQAIIEFKKAEELAFSGGNLRIAASANNNLGNISLAQGALQDALIYYQKAADIGPPSIEEVALVNIGLVHIELNNPEKAMDYLLEAKEMTSQSENWYALAFIHQHLGSLERSKSNLPEALDYYQKAMDIYKSINERQFYSEVLTSIASVYYEKKLYLKALAAYNESIQIQKEISHYAGWCNSLHGMGEVYLAMGNISASEKTLIEALNIADKNTLLTLKDDIVLTLSTLYKNSGRYKKALAYHELYKQLSDSLLNQEKQEQIDELETRFETKQKQQEIDLLSAENQIANLNVLQQTNFRNYVIIIAFILAILAAVAYNRVQVKAKANNKLKELDQLKTNFFTDISHEFRTPLTLILSPVSKALKSEQNSPIKHDLELIQRNAERLLELTNQLLDLSKLEAGKLKLTVRPYNLHDFLQVSVASFESFAPSKNIDFKIELKDVPTSAYFDQDNLQKILNNLLSNAFKFTPDGGCIILKADAAKKHLNITVKDTGPGISEKQQRKVFDRFYQNDNNEQGGGSGIGLTLTKELVLLHHGSISLDSAVGVGSTFKFSIPIEASAYQKKEIDASLTEPLKPASTFNDSIEWDQIKEKEGIPIALIVEDNFDLSHHIRSVLSEKYTVFEAKNGVAGVERAMELIPDIIISDWMMPKMDGLEFCKKVKEDQRSSHIPIIMLTAKADVSSKLEGLKTGADEYLTKPFNTEELLARMENLISQRAHLKSIYSKRITVSPSKIEVTDPNEAFLQKALGIVDSHIEDNEFTVEKFQGEMAMSRMQLHRKLKALTDFSASEFIRNLRLQRAADLLSSNGMQVSEVAYKTGFNSLSYFTQCFKEKYGVIPSQYESIVP